MITIFSRQISSLIFRRQVANLVILIVCLTCFCQAKAFYLLDEDTAKSELTVYRFNRTSRAISEPLSPERYRISYELVTVDEPIEFILEKRKIYSNDVDVYNLLYELNPQIKKIGTLDNGIRLSVPKIELIDINLIPDEILILRLDEKLKNRLTELASKLQPLIADSQKSKSNAFGYLSLITSAIQTHSKLISHDNLIDILYESEELSKLDPGALKRIKEIETYLSERSSDLRDIKSGNEPPDSYNVPVKVSVFKRGGKNPQQGYRVFYIGYVLYPNGLPHPISKTAPIPLEDFIPEGTWRVWAVMAGQPPDKPATEVLEVKLRTSNDGKSSVIDLFLK